MTQRFPVTLRLEGTVRGTGAICIAADDCSTNVPGLYAAGDAATRELICGGFTGGGSHNAAWAISSGTWAGRAAAGHAQSMGGPAATLAARRGTCRTAVVQSCAGARPRERDSRRPGRGVPLRQESFRTTRGLSSSLQRLDELWREAQAPASGGARERIRGREAAALVATARWMYASALERQETRGMHKHMDHPAP
ncbi:MAG TPA: FAD-binding protein, partial [Polyangiaceae bacterium]|nr:FAD-binding protein [Polyangiaceae bacterium]